MAGDKEESCCGNNCDEHCAIGVTPDDPPPVTCYETCTSVLSKCHWWLIAFLLNLIFSPIVLTYHAARIYLKECILVYIERSCGCLIKCCCESLCCEFCWRFTDSAFPPNSKSLGETEKRFARGERDPACCCPGPHEKGGDVEWLRADQIPGFGRDGGKLFQGGIMAEDIAQGQLGNCWLLAAIATSVLDLAQMNLTQCLNF